LKLIQKDYLQGNYVGKSCGDSKMCLCEAVLRVLGLKGWNTGDLKMTRGTNLMQQFYLVS